MNEASLPWTNLQIDASIIYTFAFSSFFSLPFFFLKTYLQGIYLFISDIYTCTEEYTRVVFNLLLAYELVQPGSPILFHFVYLESEDLFGNKFGYLGN